MPAPLMFAGARAAVGKLLSQMGMQGMKAPIKAGLSAMKPSGVLDGVLTVGPDIANQIGSQMFLPENVNLQDRLLVAGENLAMDSIGGTLGGRFLGGAMAPWAVNKFRKRTLTPKEYQQAISGVTTGTEMVTGFGFGYGPRPLTEGVYERSFQRAQADPELEEIQRQQLEQQQMINAFGNAGAVGLRGLYEAIPVDPYDMRTYMGLL